jgi:hypothetical protein
MVVPEKDSQEQDTGKVRQEQDMRKAKQGRQTEDTGRRKGCLDCSLALQVLSLDPELAEDPVAM